MLRGRGGQAESVLLEGGPVELHCTGFRGSMDEFSPLHRDSFSAPAVELVQQQIASLQGYSTYTGKEITVLDWVAQYLSVAGYLQGCMHELYSSLKCV